MAEQNYENHVKWVPLFHWFVLPMMLINFGWSIYRLKTAGFSWDGLVGVLTAAALLMLPILARTFALKVQDRVIRLEERLRFEQLLPNDLKPRIGEFTPAQFVALRFASDGEVAGLARKVLTENLQDRKAIKRLVKNW